MTPPRGRRDGPITRRKSRGTNEQKRSERVSASQRGATSWEISDWQLGSMYVAPRSLAGAMDGPTPVALTAPTDRASYTYASTNTTLSTLCGGYRLKELYCVQERMRVLVGVANKNAVDFSIQVA